MYIYALIAVLWFFLFGLDYQPNNNCVFHTTFKSSFLYNSKSTNINITKKNVRRNTTISTLIPQRIFQTHQRDQAPSNILNTVEIILHLNPTFSYDFFNATQRRQFIQKNFPPNLLAAYDKIVPKAFKADIWRYSVVYINGGCYMDVGSHAVGSLLNIISQNDTFISTIDTHYSGVNSAFFCASPRHPLLKLNLDDIIDFIESSSYGQTDLSITGPHRFANSFRKYFSLQPKSNLQAKQYSPGIKLYQRQQHDDCLFAQLKDYNNTVFVYNKYPGYYADQMSHVPQPRYGDLWTEMKVYGEDRDGQEIVVKEVENGK